MIDAGATFHKYISGCAASTSKEARDDLMSPPTSQRIPIHIALSRSWIQDSAHGMTTQAHVLGLVVHG